MDKKKKTPRRAVVKSRDEATQKRAQIRQTLEGKDVLSLEEMAALADCSEPPVARACRAHLAGLPGLVCAKPSNSMGFKITKRRGLEWIEAGMPGTDFAGGDEEKGASDEA